MLSDIEPMVWLIIGAATIISVAVVFAKTIKVVLKLAVVAVMLAFVGYYLVQAGIIQLP
ncbi:MAG: hypothetical protein U9P12_09010 [Verrucomicrobiota bacterium]|nr:hypothetical protein [Verrucomicrobiota bacterium]